MPATNLVIRNVNWCLCLYVSQFYRFQITSRIKILILIQLKLDGFCLSAK